jgi:hypothetical protein
MEGQSNIFEHTTSGLYSWWFILGAFYSLQKLFTLVLDNSINLDGDMVTVVIGKFLM